MYDVPRAVNLMYRKQCASPVAILYNWYKVFLAYTAEASSIIDSVDRSYFHPNMQKKKCVHHIPISCAVFLPTGLVNL